MSLAQDIKEVLDSEVDGKLELISQLVCIDLKDEDKLWKAYEEAENIIKEYHPYAGINTREQEGDGVRLEFYYDYFDYSGGRTSEYFTFKELGLDD